MSGKALTQDKLCRSLGFVDNPPRGYFKTVKTCYPGGGGGAGNGPGGRDVDACNVGTVELLDSPAPNFDPEDVAESFRDITLSNGTSKLNFRRWACYGDDNSIPGSLRSPACDDESPPKPICVLRGTDSANDMIHLRNFTSARTMERVEFGDECDFVPTVLGVSCDDSSVVFNKMKFAKGFILPPNGNGDPVIGGGVDACNVGMKGSPDAIVTLPDVGEVFDAIDQTDDQFKFRFRRLVSGGSDTVVGPTPAPASVLRGTDEYGDVICFRNLNNVPDPVIEGVDCFSILAGVSEDDTTVMFNPICLGSGLAVIPSSPAGGAPVISLDAKIRDCNTFLNSPVAEALTLVPGGEQTAAEVDSCFTLASILPSNTILITNQGNEECPIYQFSFNLLSQSPAIDAVLAGCLNIPLIVPGLVDGLAVGDGTGCVEPGEVCAGLVSETGILEFRKLISQGSGDTASSGPLIETGPFAVLRDTFDAETEQSPAGAATEKYIRFRNLANIPVQPDSPETSPAATEACPVLAGVSNDCSTVLFRQLVAGPNVKLTCEADRIVVNAKSQLTFSFASEDQSISSARFIGLGVSANGTVFNGFRDTAVVSPCTAKLIKLVAVIKTDTIIMTPDTVTITVYTYKIGESPADIQPPASGSETALTCVVPLQNVDINCCAAVADVPIEACELFAIRVVPSGVTNFTVAGTVILQEL